MNIRSAPRLVPTFLLLLAAACNQDATGSTGQPADLPAGSLSFNYNGMLSGTFQAEGAAPATGQGGGTWVVASPGERTGRLSVVAQLAHASGADAATLDVPEAAGLYVAGCTGDGCARMQVRFGTAAAVAPGTTCELVGGGIEVHEVTDRTVRGQFHGVAQCTEPGQARQLVVSVAEGEFEAPRRTIR